MSSFPPPPEPMMKPPPPPRRREPEREPSDSRPAANYDAYPDPPAPRRSLAGWMTLLAVVAIPLAILIPAGLGVSVGLQERSTYMHSQAESHFQQALAYESENYRELAIAELQIAVKFDPGYAEAQAKLDEMQKGGANGTPVPDSQAIADQLFKRAQDALAQKQWSDAIDFLEEIRRADANYHAGEIQSLLEQAYLNAGKESIAAGRIEQARARLESALALNPDNAEIKTLRDRAALYVTGVQAVQTNPQIAAVNLQQLYQQDQNFFDVRNQLLNAYVLYGDDAFRQGAFCVAAREYGQAANLGAAMGSKLTQANASCKQAVLATATPPPVEGTPGATPVTVSLGSFVVQARQNMGDECQGIGSASGTVRDAAENPLTGVSVRIYNDNDYRPPPFKTDGSGQYSIVLGKDAGLFHLVVLGQDGQPASGIYDLNYAGGLAAGCRWIIDWTRNP